MMIQLDNEQRQVLRELLQHDLHELRVESARADIHDYREMLHHRENVVESVLAKLASENTMAL